MSDEAAMYVSLTVSSDDPSIITRAIEAMARCAAGLALEGVFVSLNCSRPDEDEE